MVGEGERVLELTKTVIAPSTLLTERKLKAFKGA
jgi:hypothetical protein